MADWLQAYAMTEASHQMTSNPLPKHGPHKAGTVGRAQGSVKVLLPCHTHPCRRILTCSLAACHCLSQTLCKSTFAVVGCDMVSAPVSISVDVKCNLYLLLWVCNAFQGCYCSQRALQTKASDKSLYAE